MRDNKTERWCGTRGSRGICIWKRKAKVGKLGDSSLEWF